MPSEDKRRKLIAEAMAMRTEFHHRDAVRMASTEALPVAVELIEELTEKVAELEEKRELARLYPSIGKDPRTEAAEATIAKQAKEIERLRDALGYGHPNLRRTDITGTDVHGDGQ